MNRLSTAVRQTPPMPEGSSFVDQGAANDLHVPSEADIRDAEILARLSNRAAGRDASESFYRWYDQGPYIQTTLGAPVWDNLYTAAPFGKASATPLLASDFDLDISDEDAELDQSRSAVDTLRASLEAAERWRAERGLPPREGARQEIEPNGFEDLGDLDDIFQGQELGIEAQSQEDKEPGFLSMVVASTSAPLTLVFGAATYAMGSPFMLWSKKGRKKLAAPFNYLAKNKVRFGVDVTGSFILKGILTFGAGFLGLGLWPTLVVAAGIGVATKLTMTAVTSPNTFWSKKTAADAIAAGIWGLGFGAIGLEVANALREDVVAPSLAPDAIEAVKKGVATGVLGGAVPTPVEVLPGAGDQIAGSVITAFDRVDVPETPAEMPVEPMLQNLPEIPSAKPDIFPISADYIDDKAGLADMLLAADEAGASLAELDAISQEYSAAAMEVPAEANTITDTPYLAQGVEVSEVTEIPAEVSAADLDQMKLEEYYQKVALKDVDFRMELDSDANYIGSPHSADGDYYVQVGDQILFELPDGSTSLKVVDPLDMDRYADGADKVLIGEFMGNGAGYEEAGVGYRFDLREAMARGNLNHVFASAPAAPAPSPV